MFLLLPEEDLLHKVHMLFACCNQQQEKSFGVSMSIPSAALAVVKLTILHIQMKSHDNQPDKFTTTGAGVGGRGGGSSLWGGMVFAGRARGRGLLVTVHTP